MKGLGLALAFVGGLVALTAVALQVGRVAGLAAALLAAVILGIGLGVTQRRPWKRFYAGTGVEEWRRAARRLSWRDRWTLHRATMRGRAAPPHLAEPAVHRATTMAAVNRRMLTGDLWQQYHLSLAVILGLIGVFWVVWPLVGGPWFLAVPKSHRRRPGDRTLLLEPEAVRPPPARAAGAVARAEPAAARRGRHCPRVAELLTPLRPRMRLLGRPLARTLRTGGVAAPRCVRGCGGGSDRLLGRCGGRGRDP